jgi:disulfide bond formation protein DsbB
MTDGLKRNLPGLLALASAAMLAGAFGFQYIGGLDPCVLCLYQRYPHGLVIIIAGLAWLLRDLGRFSNHLTLLAGLVLLVGAGIAAFHMGVEYQWWAGTAECGAKAQPTTLAELRAQIMAQQITRCDEVAWSLFGISMAGYNMILSLVLAAAALCAAWTGWRR